MTVKNTLQERGNRYGDFTDHAEIAQDLQMNMRSTEGWERLDAVKRQALTVIADKIARILNGDPEYKDNWHDIQGYAKLAEDRCHSPAPETYEQARERVMQQRDKLEQMGLEAAPMPDLGLVERIVEIIEPHTSWTMRRHESVYEKARAILALFPFARNP